MFQAERFFNRTLVITITCMTTLSLLVANLAGQQQGAVGQKQLKNVGGNDVKTVLFKDANAAMNVAIKAQADILAPDNFSEAMKRYKRAEVDLEKGKGLDDIRDNLGESIAYFQKAIDATKLAEVTFPNS
ncbi:hypothetical protein JW935_14020, partial [candidate division KSB1 bacterium]|nr:hypothetical protein [candidate division KSB1 bacterium]